MRFVIDMGLSTGLVPWLKDLGHDAFHLVERNQQKAKDHEILALAQQEQRVILTADNDFSQLVAAQEADSPSIVLFRLSNYRFGYVQDRLRHVLDTYHDRLLRGCIISVTDHLLRVRNLPIRKRDT